MYIPSNTYVISLCIFMLKSLYKLDTLQDNFTALNVRTTITALNVRTIITALNVRTIMK